MEPVGESNYTMDSLHRRSSRSRSTTPAEFNGVTMSETKSSNRRTKRITPSKLTATSTPKDDAGTATNSLTAISESYSETIVTKISNSASVNSNNIKSQRNTIDSNSKIVRRSGRPKVFLSDQLTNGESTTIKESPVSTTKTTSSSTNVTNRKKAALIKATKMSEYSSDDEDEKHKTLRTYKNAGEWWNTFPKTDYTYSPVSEFRTEVAPGVYPVPNMSRRSLASLRGLSSPPTSLEANTYSSSSSRTMWSNRYGARDNKQSGYDYHTSNTVGYSDVSDVDEVDEVVHRKTEQASVNYFTAFFTSVLTVITTVWTSTVTTTYGAWQRVTGTQIAADYSTPRRNNTVAASRTWFQAVTDGIYLMFAQLEVIDTRILSWFHSDNLAVNEANKKRRLKYFIMFLMFLLLPLAACWVWGNSTDIDPVANVWKMKESWSTLTTFLLYPFSGSEEENYYTETVPQPLTPHHSKYVPAPTLPSHITMAAGEVIDLDKLTTQVVNSQQMQLLLSASQKPVDYEAIIMRIINSERVKTMISSNQKDVDVASLTAGIMASDELKQLIASGQKDVDLEAVTFFVLNSAQMREYLSLHQREPDVDMLATQIVNSGELRQFVAASQKEVDIEALIGRVLASVQMQNWMAANQKDANIDSIIALVLASGELQNARDVDQLVAKVTSSAQLQTLVAGATDKASLANLQLEQTRLEKKLDEKSGMLEEQIIARLSNSLAGLEKQIKILQDQQATIRACCDKPAPGLPLVAIEQHVTRFLAGVFGQSTAGEMTPDELKAWIANVFVAKDDLEARLANLIKHSKQDVTEATEQSANKIMQTISERMSEQYVIQQHQVTPGSSIGLSNDQVRAIVNDALVTYDADKTGMVDYALESSGGQIISTRCTEIYYKRSGSILLFGIPLWNYQGNNPRSVLQPGVHPGECWAFAGSRGYLVIELAGVIRISSFSIEHIPRALAFAGVIDSAPKDFIVLGLESLNDPEPLVLGTYKYDQNGTSLQHFIVKHSPLKPYKLIELKIESNHGNMEYTCLYRFRVHGTWVSN